MQSQKYFLRMESVKFELRYNLEKFLNKVDILIKKKYSLFYDSVVGLVLITFSFQLD